jgi:hypothetical protein
MYKLTLIILLFSEFTLYSQKQINIVSTNNISLQDQKNIENLISLIKSDKKLKESKIEFFCLLSIDESSSTLTQNSEIDLTSNFSNKLFLDKTSEEKFLEEQIKNGSNLEFVVNSNSFPLNIEFSFSDIQELFKKLKKDKSNKINIVYNNGYLPFLYSKENITKTLTSAQTNGGLDKYTPKITNPNSAHRDLRPDGSHYYINYTIEDIFPSFNIELYLLLLNGDSILLLDECVPITDITEFRNNKQTIDLAVTHDNDNKYSLAIKETFIVDLFYKNGMKYIKSTDFPDIDDCSDCKYKTLYRQKFTLSIKGCSPNVLEKIVPVGYLNTNFFLFQCSNKSQKNQ